MSNQEIKMTRRIKLKTLLKRKTKDLKREDTIPHRINKIVTVTEIDQIEAATGSIL